MNAPRTNLLRTLSTGDRAAGSFPTALRAFLPPRRSVCCALLALLGVVVAAAPAVGQDRTAEIDSLFSFVTSETPGCAVGVSQRGQVLANRTYGLADVAQREPLTPRHAFDIGSTHKQFVAAAVLLLAEEGRLSLSDDIHQYLPELPDYGHPITVDHLLTHTSGIRDWTGLLPLAEEGADVLELILRQRGLNFVPGQAWSYSNSGYVLLKEIVARVGGMPFADFVRERVFEPLGMASSAYVEDILHGTGARALAYQKEGESWKEFMRLGNRRGGGTVISTAGDLLKWNDALTNGRLGPYVTAKLQEPARLDNGRVLTYARGLIVETNRGRPMVWHSGGAAGYSSVLSRFADHGLSVAVLCNFEPVSATALSARVADLFLPPVDPAAEPPGPVAVPGVDVSGRAGLYFSVETGEPMRLAVNGGRLAIAGGGPLVPVSENRFRPQRATLFFRSEDAFELVFTSQDAFDIVSQEGQATRYQRAEPWTPTPGELQAVDGRYGSDELGRTFELVPGTAGLVFRVEGAPEEAIELEPVARDTYMVRLMILRVLRDAGGNVTGFSYGNPVVRDMRFTRLGDRAATSPALPPAEATAAAPATPAPPLENLVGTYEMGPGRTVTVTLEDGQLYGQPTGNAKRPLVHVSGATFAVGQADSPITVTFTLGTNGRADALVMRQNGGERLLPRVQ